MSPILMLVADRSPMFTSTIVIAGMVIVFAVLIILIVIFTLYGKIMSKLSGTSKDNKNTIIKTQQPSAPIASAPAAKPPVVENGISPQVVAAIVAAIEAYEGKGAVIHSVRRVDVGSRNPWAAAAVMDNTRPF